MGYCLGVDIGTTFSAVAVARGGRAEIVSLGHHAAAIPSLVFLREDGSFLVGDAAGRRGLVEPGRLAREFKRRFGDTTAILLGGTPWSADALTSQLLRHLVAEATAQQGSPPDRVAVTHPASWGPYKTDLLRQAARAAGLPDAELMTEPEAAALHYAATERVEPGEIVAIYDLGGGTFDAAVLARTEDGFTLVGQPEGIERLGGIDFDEAVLAHVSGFLGPAVTDLDPRDPAALAAMARLRSDCTAAKEALSADTEVSIPVLLPSVQTEIRLTRGEFEGMIRPTLSETMSALGRSIRSAGVEPAQVKVVLLVGGSSRIPLVGQLVAGEIGRPVAVDVHPKHAVALGAGAAVGGAGPSAAAAAPAPPAPSPRRETPPVPEDAPVATGAARRRRRPFVLVAAALVVLVAVVAGLLARGGGKEAARLPPEVPTFELGVGAQTVATAEGTVWLGLGNATVARFDTASSRIAGTVRVGGGDDSLAVAAGAGAVWAADPDAGTVSRVDPGTNTVTATYNVGRKPHAVLVAAGAVWVTVEDDGVVMRIDPGSGTMTPIRVRGKPRNLAYGAGILWVTDPANDNLARIDAGKSIVVGDGESGGCPGWIAADETTVWVQDECKVSTVFQVDPATGKVTGTATVGKDAKGMVLAGGSLWVVNASDGTVSQVDERSRQVLRTIRVGSGGTELAADDHSVWVANTSDGTLSRIPL